MIKDSIVNLKKSLRMTLQNVPAVVDTLIRGLDGIQEEADASAAYSDDETPIGTWIDNKTIYRKVIVLTEPVNCTASTFTNLIATPEGIDKIIFGYVNIANNGAGTGYVRNYNGYIQYLFPVATAVNTLIIHYTKTAANRPPENDTKNGGDDPDVKTVDEDPVEQVPEDLKK